MENYTLATGYQQREELKEGFNCLANRSIWIFGLGIGETAVVGWPF